MKKQQTIFDFLGQVFMLFGVTVLMLLVISLVLGNDSRNYSMMISLGNEGLPTATLLQFLGVSIMINGLELIFFTDKWIKTGHSGLRTMGMLSVILACLSGFIYVFKWFPMDEPLPWFMFFTFFFVSFGVSTVIVFWKEKMENRKMAEGLDRIKAQLKEDSDGTHH